MPLILYQAKVLNIFTKLNIWNSFEQKILKLQVSVFSSKTKQPHAPKRFQFEWKLKTKCTQIIKNKIWLIFNLGHTFYSMFFDIVHLLNWFWREAKTDRGLFKKNLISVCHQRAGRWKGTFCFWRAASCRQWHLLEGAQHPGDSHHVSGPEQFGTLRGLRSSSKQYH